MRSPRSFFFFSSIYLPARASRVRRRMIQSRILQLISVFIYRLRSFAKTTTSSVDSLATNTDALECAYECHDDTATPCTACTEQSKYGILPRNDVFFVREVFTIIQSELIFCFFGFFFNKRSVRQAPNTTHSPDTTLEHVSPDRTLRSGNAVFRANNV